MASKAPFGTDVQPEFDTKLIGGKLVQVPKATQLENTTTSFLQLKAKESANDFVAFRAHRHLQEDLGHADGKQLPPDKPKRSRKLISLPTINEENYKQDTEFLTFDQLLSPRKLAGTKALTDHGAGLQVHSKSNNSGVRAGIRGQRPSRKNCLSDLVRATNRQKQTTLLNILEPAVDSVLNKVHTIEDVLHSCTRLDERRVGVLETSYAARAFRSFGVKISDTDLLKLAELTGSSIGSDHILYRKLCGILMNVLSGRNLNLDTLNEKSTSTHTPCASVETYSPESEEDYELTVNNKTIISHPQKLQMQRQDFESERLLATPQLKQRPPAAKTKRYHSRLAKTQPLKESQLPRLVDKYSYTYPLLRQAGHPIASHRPMLSNSNEEFATQYAPSLKSEGMERLQSALESCADDEGMIDSVVALRIVKNYNLIYSLRLALEDIRRYLKNRPYPHNNIAVDKLMKVLK